MPRAPRICTHAGCTTLVRTGRCTQHQPPPWQGPRTASSKITSTRAWRTLAAQVLTDDHHQCRINTPGTCIGHATVVDKIIPAARRPDLAWDRTNLRAACKPCNDHKARTTDQTRRLKR